jgi:prepilin-type N-terminal cleavage/methylation domain-containing protein
MRVHRAIGRLQRSGVTLIELCIVLAILGLMVSLMVPGIQGAREAARGMACQARIRDFTQASMIAADTQRKLPESRFFVDDQNRILRERTWGRFISPMTPPSHPWHSIDNGFQRTFESLFRYAPAVRTCPSSLSCSELSVKTAASAGDSEGQVITATSDYRGSLGVQNGFSGSTTGVFSIKKNGSPSRGLQSITDGLSTTIMAWETIGAKYVRRERNTGRLLASDWKTFRYRGRNQIFFDLGESGAVSTPMGDLDGYLFGWSGTASGAILVDTLGSGDDPNQFIQRILESNAFGEPFSLHGGRVSIAHADGSTAWLSNATDFPILVARISIDEGEIESSDE